MAKQEAPIDQEKKVEELHRDSQHWKSLLRLMQDEILFIDRLLNSYVFEPNTPDLFERLTNYKERIEKIKTHQTVLRKAISKHENDLGGMLECRNRECDLGYYKRHNELKEMVASCTDVFQNLKTEIFNYAGGILKKRKP